MKKRKLHSQDEKFDEPPIQVKKKKNKTPRPEAEQKPKRKRAPPKEEGNVCVPTPLFPQATPDKFLDKIKELTRDEITSWEQMEMVIEKELNNTDVSTHHNRLQIPQRQIKRDFLNEDEKKIYHATDPVTNKYKSYTVKILEPSLQENNISFGVWTMGQNKMYKFNGDHKLIGNSWNEVVRNNGLYAGMTIQLWRFRVRQELWFGILGVNPRTYHVGDQENV